MKHKDKLKISILVWNLSTNDGYIRASLLQKSLMQLGYEVEILGFYLERNYMQPFLLIPNYRL